MSTGKQRNLNQLLESVQNAHRKDIVDFAGGHLNESRLYKPPTSWSYEGWESSKKEDIVMKQKSKIPRSKKSVMRRNDMKETMVQFATGTTGTYLPPSPVEAHVAGEMDSISPDQYDKVRDNRLITELNIGEIMLPGARSYRTKSWSEQDFAPEEISKPIQTQGDLRAKNLAAKSRREFVPIPVGAATKTDQYRSQKRLENELICKAEAQERKVLQGSKSAQYLENKLKANLESLNEAGYGPNFNRLQVYVDIFHDLINESPTFGHVLKTILDEYSDYIDFLVESHPNQHGTLREQVDSLASKGVSKPLDLARERKAVSDLEVKGKQLLDANEKLRREIEAEEQLVSQLEGKKPKRTITASYQERHDITSFTLEEKIEDLRANILERLDEINNLKKTLNSEYVPASVCLHLQSCVKDTETEVQRLIKHNELIANETEELERELAECIELVGGDEEDQERMWRKIDGDPTDPGYYSPRSEDDDSKWAFYIS